MKSREIRKQLEAQRLQELAELEAIKEFEKPWPDPLASKFKPFKFSLLFYFLNRLLVFAHNI